MLYFPLRDTDKVWWSNVQRKARFLPAYHCSISSSVLPEIDGVRGWTKARDWKAINYFLFFLCWGGWHYHKALSAGWDHKLSWAPPVFMTGEGGARGGAEGCAWHRISINSDAGNVSLSLFLSPSHSAPCLFYSIFFSSSFCLSLFLCAILIPLSALSISDFLLTGILSTIFLWHSHPPHPTSSLSLLSVPPLCPPLSFSHTWGCRWGWKVTKYMISCKNKYI